MSSFDVYYLGAEQGGWRTLLADAGVTRVGLSYWSALKGKRIPKKGLDIGSWGFEGVLLESGGFQANAKPEQHTQGEWKAYGDAYAEFVLDHIDDLELVVEFDCLSLGQTYIQDMRAAVWSQVDPQKFLPVWHPEQGLPMLETLGELYPRVAISEQAITTAGLNVTPHLNALARKGVLLHGIAMTKPTTLKQVAFTTAASTSWLSPMRFGDTQVWVNNQLTRYPVKMKQQARLRHRSLIEEIGLDADKVLADDKTEVTRLALWSWTQQEAALRALRMDERADRSNNAVVHGEVVNEATGEVGVVTAGRDAGNADMPLPPLQQRAEGAVKSLPMLGSRKVSAYDETTRAARDIELMEIRGTSSRRCDTCVIKSKCEEFKPNTTCAFSIPLEIRTKEQRASFMTGMIELQAGRVMFGAMVEQVNGGYPDPNLSQEYDRMLKAIQVQADLEDNRDFLRISVEARGKTGVLSRLFSPENAAKATQLGQQLSPQETDEVAGRILEGQRVT